MEKDKILSGAEDFFMDLGRSSMHYFKGARGYRPPWGPLIYDGGHLVFEGQKRSGSGVAHSD